MLTATWLSINRAGNVNFKNKHYVAEVTDYVPVIRTLRHPNDFSREPMHSEV